MYKPLCWPQCAVGEQSQESALLQALNYTKDGRAAWLDHNVPADLLLQLNLQLQNGKIAKSTHTKAVQLVNHHAPATAAQDMDQELTPELLQEHNAAQVGWNCG